MDLQTRLARLNLKCNPRDPMGLLTCVERRLEAFDLKGDSATERLIELANLQVVREMLRERLLWVHARFKDEAPDRPKNFTLPGTVLALGLERTCSQCDWAGSLPDVAPAVCPACQARLNDKSTLVFGGVKVTYRGKNLGFSFADGRNLYVVLDDADVRDTLRFMIRRYPIF